MEPRSQSILLELEPTSDPHHIAGCATAAGELRTFTGWLGLIAAIDALHARAIQAHEQPNSTPAATDDRPAHND